MRQIAEQNNSEYGHFSRSVWVTSDFIGTARFQSDSLERRFGQYQQMSCGRFLFGSKEIKYYGKILKYKAYYK